MEYASPPAGLDGFDPAHFQLRQIPTPSWASGERTWGVDVPETVREAVSAQKDEIRRATEAALHWGLTDKEAIRRFWPSSSSANGVDGTYFTGRRHVALDGSERLLVETECCLCGVNQRGEQYVYDRYLILLRWDLKTRTGENVLMGEAERGSVLATLTLHLDAPERPEDVPDFVFPSWPSSAGGASESYLGYDLSITLDGEGPLGFELYGSMAL